METKKMNLYQKLLNIQKQVVGLGEDKKSFGYKYVSGSKVLSHVKPLMNEMGLLLKQEVVEMHNERQDYALKNGTEKSEILTRVMMRFTWIDTESGETDVNMFGANGQNDWEKGLGSALTYAERYFLLKYFHISTDKDDIDNPERKEGATNGNDEKPKVKKPKPVDKKFALKGVDKVIEALETNKDATLKTLSKSKYFTKAQYDELKGTGLLNDAELKTLEVR